MNHVIISDLHLGSQFSRRDDFATFVKNLPSGVCLILNGDTVDMHARFTDSDLEVLDLLRKESSRRGVIWVQGNHDEKYVLDDPRDIEFVPSYHIDNKMFISHGHKYDGTCFFRRRASVTVLFSLYSLYTRLGGRPMHPATYAKKFRHLFQAFKNRTVKNAVTFAKQNGYQAIVCGHTHCVDDLTVDGIRFLNAGCWTETPLTYISVNNEIIELKRIGS